MDLLSVGQVMTLQWQDQVELLGGAITTFLPLTAFELIVMLEVFCWNVILEFI